MCVGKDCCCGLCQALEPLIRKTGPGEADGASLMEGALLASTVFSPPQPSPIVGA